MAAFPKYEMSQFYKPLFRPQSGQSPDVRDESQMMDNKNIQALSHANLIEIERRAHQLRAEYVRDCVLRAVGYFKSLIGHGYVARLVGDL